MWESARLNQRPRAVWISNQALSPAIRTAVVHAKPVILNRAHANADNPSEVKLAAARAGITRVEVRERKLMLTRGGDFVLVGGKFPRLVAPTIEPLLREVLDMIRKF